MTEPSLERIEACYYDLLRYNEQLEADHAQRITPDVKLWCSSATLALAGCLIAFHSRTLGLVVYCLGSLLGIPAWAIWIRRVRRFRARKRALEAKWADVLPLLYREQDRKR